MPLNATPKSSTANSYLTQADADDLFTERLYAPEWTAAVTGDKDKSLMMATWILEQVFDWEGTVTDLNQRLAWPRLGVIDAQGRYVDQETVPRQVKRAAAELALYLLRRDRTEEPELLGLGFTEAGVGPLRVRVDPDQVLNLLPRTVILIIDPLGTPKGNTGDGGIGFVKLVRT